MGMADIAEVLWRDYLKHNPGNPEWVDRDRFVLSNGHGSMLLYSLLHLTGYPLTINEIRNFRQFGYRTAGHPEYEADLGIETTTGPLGQGISNAVGMALAEKMLAAQFNRDDHAIVNHRTWAFLGDGCLMEGISHEACSLAGTLKLGKLVAFYDDNNISIDGEVGGWFTDDTAARFEAYGWQVIRDVDGHDSAAIAAAIDAALADNERPSLLCCKTVIGFGAPNKQGTAATHGAPLGDDEISAARETLGWSAEPFEIPAEIASAWNGRERGRVEEDHWDVRFRAYRAEQSIAGRGIRAPRCGRSARRLVGKKRLRRFATLRRPVRPWPRARRRSWRSMRLAPVLPEMAGGAADLTGSNLTKHAGSVPVTADDASGKLHLLRASVNSA